MSEQLFIAISYDNNQLFKDFQKSLAQQLQPLLKKYNCKLTMQHHIHLTLYFLGQQPADQIHILIDLCQKIIDLQISQYGLDSLSDYSSKIKLEFIGHHGVIAVTLELSPELINLYNLFIPAFEKNTQKKSQPFLPHITLARIKNITRRDLKHFKNDASKMLHSISHDFQESIPLAAEEIIFFSSTGSEYKDIKRFII
jgi:2'-5' RNA ligase